MNFAINRSVGFECVPRELVAKTTSYQRQCMQSRAEFSSADSYLYAHVAAVDPQCRGDEHELFPQDDCLGREFEMQLGVKGFNF